MTLAPHDDWKTDWRLGVDSAAEERVAGEILEVFKAFWEAEGVHERAESTRRRYSGALHHLGGYLVEQALEEDWPYASGQEAVRAEVEPEEGPLIHGEEEEARQRELDAVCKKLNRYFQKQR